MKPAHISRFEKLMARGRLMYLLSTGHCLWLVWLVPSKCLTVNFRIKALHCMLWSVR